MNGAGKEVVGFFEENLLNDFSKEYAEKVCEFHKAYCPSEFVNEQLHSQLLQLLNDINTNEFLYGCYALIGLSENESYTLDELIIKIYNGINDGETLKENQIFEELSLGIEYYTTFFHIMFPELFIPYYFKYNFNVFENIASEFDIDLPPIPIKKDYKGRFFYYGDICRSLYDFRINHDMSPYELCAFLYDFAPKYIGGIDSYIIQDLPQLKSAYLIGASKDDAFLSKDNDAIRPWQCSPDTLAGDAIVMYLKSPISAIDSVWRSVSIGFNDPFFYYYRCTYIAKPCKINRISQKMIEKDSVFKELPIVKKNMQGLNGVELYPSAYNHLLDMTESDLPKLEFAISDDGLLLSREKDVENKLIKPFLAKLGYLESEYKQQLYIEIGNHNHALIPDFVIHPVVSKGHQSADFLIEAKLSISSDKLLEEAKTQARGYAKLLNAKYSVVASKEGIWLSSCSDDYSRDIFSFSWSELKNEDNFYQISKLIRNRKK